MLYKRGGFDLNSLMGYEEDLRGRGYSRKDLEKSCDVVSLHHTTKKITEWQW